MVFQNLAYDTPICDDRVPGTDLRDSEWFDGDSEGPYRLDEVEAMIFTRPHLASEFHVTGKPQLNYAALLPERLAKLVSKP